MASNRREDIEHLSSPLQPAHQRQQVPTSATTRRENIRLGRTQSLTLGNSNSASYGQSASGTSNNTTTSSSYESPLEAHRYESSRRHRNRGPYTLRKMQRVSRHAALTTKQQWWDSNDKSMDAAVAAIQQWEVLYNALRNVLIAGVQSAQVMYGTAREGVSTMEHGVWGPVRDWILLPVFMGLEEAVAVTTAFLQSPQAQQLAHRTLDVTKQVPVVGEHVLAPGLVFSVQLMQRTYEIMLYPIPSKTQVRDTVNTVLNGMKWAIGGAVREVNLYVKRADANWTRTLSHTQWSLLGSGPYATLDKLGKREIMDHLCERYLALPDPLLRYELAAHMRRHNRPLYHDLVLSGVLRERGGDMTADDEWLSTYPVYRHLEGPFLLPLSDDEDASGFIDAQDSVLPLWYRLPNVNGKRPSDATPWIPFARSEQIALEERYRQVLLNGQEMNSQGHESYSASMPDMDETLNASNMSDAAARSAAEAREDPLRDPHAPGGEDPNDVTTTKYSTIAKWYVPGQDCDVLVDQKRHAVSFGLACPKCWKQLGPSIPPLLPHKVVDLCEECIGGEADAAQMPVVSTFLAPPPVMSRMRPTFWRFHGPGDEVRRATWVLETSRHGLQPFGEEAQALLEDAYLFLKWMSVRQEFDSSEDLNGALLTVEVPGPDGTERLVQFSSLTQATAIQKGVLSAVMLYKRRVYRGAWLHKHMKPEDEARDNKASVEQSILQAVEQNGSLGDTLVPDTGLRSVLTPPRDSREHRVVLFAGDGDLAIPPPRLWMEDMAKHMDDPKDGNIDHLCLIIHGIGEMLQSMDIFGLPGSARTIIDCAGSMRQNHAEVQDAHFSEMYPTANSTAKASTGRVEFLPIEWHEAFSVLSQRRNAKPQTADKLNVLMEDISLRTIPTLRTFANDTLLDVLYFMSDDYHEIIVSIVTEEMNAVVDKFCRLTGFSGRISLIGHSLGSIITWDILGHQNLNDESRDTAVVMPGNASIERLESYADSHGENPEVTAPATSAAPVSTEAATMYPRLDFAVDNFFLLGSPVAVFLMIRNSRCPLADDFTLQGCNRVFNVFHPYDPVAYRIEPCLDPRNAEFEPSIMKHWNGGFRMHYQTKRLWRKLIDTTYKTQQEVVEAFEASMAKMGLLDSTSDTFMNDDDTIGSEISDENRGCGLTLGMLNQGRRIDFMLQEKEIETANEYVSALAAHSSYWIEKDLSLFVARQVYLSTLEHAAEIAEQESWEPLSAALP